MDGSPDFSATFDVLVQQLNLLLNNLRLIVPIIPGVTSNRCRCIWPCSSRVKVVYSSSTLSTVLIPVSRVNYLVFYKLHVTSSGNVCVLVVRIVRFMIYQWERHRIFTQWGFMPILAGSEVHYRTRGIIIPHGSRNYHWSWWPFLQPFA